MIGQKYLIALLVGIFFTFALPNAVSAETREESLKRQLLLNLNEQLKSLQAQLAEINGTKISTTTPPVGVSLKKSTGSFKKLNNEDGSDDSGEGKYMLQIAVAAGSDDLYIPVSIATGRKSNGLIYQVEGSERAESTATVSCSGENSVVVTSGSLSYCKVPKGMTVSFKVLVSVVGELKEEYRVVLGHINYKLNPSDLRYKKFLLKDIRTKLLKFR